MGNILGFRVLLVFIYIYICEIEDKKHSNFVLAPANS